MKQRIFNIERSPFTRRYLLTLECGHTQWTSRKPRKDEVICEMCTAAERRKKHDKQPDA